MKQQQQQQLNTIIDNSNNNIQVKEFSSVYSSDHEKKINKWLSDTKCIIFNIITYNKDGSNTTQIFYENIQ